MIVKNINFKRIKNIPKVRFLALGLVSVIFLTGCSFATKNDDHNNLNENIEFVEQNNEYFTTINFTFDNSNYLEEYDIIYMYDESGEFCGGTRVYSTETNHTIEIPSKKFTICSKIIGSKDIIVNDSDELNITIDYLQKTIEVNEQLSNQRNK